MICNLYREMYHTNRKLNLFLPNIYRFNYDYFNTNFTYPFSVFNIEESNNKELVISKSQENIFNSIIEKRDYKYSLRVSLYCLLRLSNEEIKILNQYFDENPDYDISNNKLSQTIEIILKLLNPSVTNDEINNNIILKNQIFREKIWNSKPYYIVSNSSPHLIIFGTGAGKPSLHRKNASILFDYGNMHLLCDIGCDWYDDLCVYHSIYETESVCIFICWIYFLNIDNQFYQYYIYFTFSC